MILSTLKFWKMDIIKMKEDIILTRGKIATSTIIQIKTNHTIGDKIKMI